MITFGLILSLMAAGFILGPLFVGPGGRLQEAASINSISRLEVIKQSILKRFIDDELAFQEKRISNLAWEQRRQFLVNRYIDAARRLDFLKTLAEEQASAQAKVKGAQDA